MTIAEKLQLIAENQQKVFEAGQKSGFVQDEDKIIRKTVTGTGIVRLDDVSEVPHDIKIIAPNSEKVFISAKNMIPYPYTTSSKIQSGISFVDNGDTSVTLSGTASALITMVFTTTCPFKDGVSYTIKKLGTEGRADIYVYYTDNTGAKKYIPGGTTFVWSDNYTFGQIYIQISSSSTLYNETVYPFITIADSEDDYDCYTKLTEYVPNELGEVNIQSNLSYLTILGDGNITVEYQKSYGVQQEWDRFWDIFQNNGARTNYTSTFHGSHWTPDTFRPKYDIKPTRAENIFCGTRIPVDFVKYCEQLGIIFDTSQSTSFSYAFSQAWFSRVGEINTLLASNINYIFGWNSYIRTIDKLILKDDGSQTFTSSFAGCSMLENIIVEGVIGQNGFDMKNSTRLSKASIVSIINALSLTTTNLTVTLSKTAVNRAFETLDGAADGSTSTEWTTLIASRPNWTISLI